MIAVTGATGTIGSELVRLLSAEGAEVRALTRHPGGREALPGVAWVEADLADREAGRVRSAFTADHLEELRA